MENKITGAVIVAFIIVVYVLSSFLSYPVRGFYKLDQIPKVISEKAESVFRMAIVQKKFNFRRGKEGKIHFSTYVYSDDLQYAGMSENEDALGLVDGFCKNVDMANENDFRDIIYNKFNFKVKNKTVNIFDKFNNFQKMLSKTEIENCCRKLANNTNKESCDAYWALGAVTAFSAVDTHTVVTAKHFLFPEYGKKNNNGAKDGAEEQEIRQLFPGEDNTALIILKKRHDRQEYNVVFDTRSQRDRIKGIFFYEEGYFSIYNFDVFSQGKSSMVEDRKYYEEMEKIRIFGRERETELIISTMKDIMFINLNKDIVPEKDVLTAKNAKFDFSVKDPRVETEVYSLGFPMETKRYSEISPGGIIIERYSDGIGMFASSGKVKALRTAYTSRKGLMDNLDPYVMMSTIDGDAGMSGAPIFDKDGNLISLLVSVWGGKGTPTLFTQGLSSQSLFYFLSKYEKLVKGIDSKKVKDHME
ncbi:MAG: trypsin-like peptidase domain-containing protein [Oligoflexia bacterium]|nr:trypsin-like peptidase domain-containing protein [Oligoflexia bacterium]